MRLLRPHRRKMTINITSLIDVLFLLLIFFLLSSTFKEQPGMKLELPESQTAEQEEVKELILIIDFDAEQNLQFRLNNVPLTLDVLADRFKELVKASAGPTMTLKADRKVPHGTIVQVMDLARQNNIKKIVIATRFPATEQQP